jgi:hypothetical protein
MTMLTPGRFIRALKRTPVLLDSLLCGVTQERASAARDGADGWNVVEIVCHLRDFEAIFFERAQRLVAEDHPVLPPFDHEVLARERDYAAQNLDEAFAAFVANREAFIEWLKARSEADWARTGIHPEYAEYSVLEQALQAVCHDIDHMEQIARVLELPCEETSARFGLG